MTKRLLVAGLSVVLALTALSGCGGDSSGAKPAAVVTPGVQPDGHYQLGTLPKEAAGPVKAAVAAMPAAFSYDYRKIDAALKAATKTMTPAFAKKFTQTFNANILNQAPAKKAIVTSLVRAAGLVGSVTGDRALVMVYLDQVLVSSKDKSASDPIKVSQNSVHVSLRKIDGTWKVDDIEPF